MKKFTAIFLLIFPFIAWAQSPGEQPGHVIAIPPIDLTQQLYSLGVTVEGTMIGYGGGAKTEHLNTQMSFAAYTVAYTAMVDAIREILTRIWALEAMGLDEQRIRELIANPRILYAE